MTHNPYHPAGGAGAVKALEWLFVEEDQTVRSVGSPIYYRLSHHRDGGWYNSSPSSGSIGDHERLNDAKSAAQADFERLILSTLSTDPSAAIAALTAERDEALEKLENCALEYQEGYAEAEFFAKQQIGEAARDVLDERRRQIEVEGWTPEHDNLHVDGELAVAAACYATAPPMVCIEREWVPPDMPKQWPWDWSWWKPGFRRRNLVRSGALIIAEIERLDRATIPQE